MTNIPPSAICNLPKYDEEQLPPPALSIITPGEPNDDVKEEDVKEDQHEEDKKVDEKLPEYKRDVVDMNSFLQTEINIEYEDSKEMLINAFRLCGIDYNPIIENILTSPEHFKNDDRPVVRKLYNAAIKYIDYKKNYVETEATKSTTNLKIYFDNTLKNMYSEAKNKIDCIGIEMDCQRLQQICRQAYRVGNETIARILSEHTNTEYSMVMEQYSKYGNIDNINDMKSKLSMEKPHYGSKIYYASTRDELILIACGMYIKEIPPYVKESGLKTLTVYIKDALEKDYSYNIPTFIDYCLKNYPNIVQEHYYFNNKPMLNSKLSFDKLKTDWYTLNEE